MVRAYINISENINRVINVVKAREGLKTKSEAIEYIINQYQEEILEAPYRLEFIKEIEDAVKEPTTHFKNVDEMRNYFGVE